tara:strand:+ start:149 stop:529 length:381 start_codon:yes stop_codon:yes gene_type:complete
MCDPYPCWEPGISEGPAGYTGKGRTKYTYTFDFFPQFYRGDPPKTNRSKSNPFENFYSWDSNQEKQENPDSGDYEFMGLKRSCSQDDLKKRYYKLAKQYHPDKSTGDTKLFQALKNAYDNIRSLFY